MIAPTLLKSWAFTKLQIPYTFSLYRITPRVIMYSLIGSVVLLLCGVALGAEDKIKHVVVVMMENRAYDHVLGWSSDLNANGLTGEECNYLNLTERTDQLCVTDDAININLCDPSHIVDATTFKVFGHYDDSNKTAVSMDGFAAYEADKDNAVDNKYCSVMSGFKASDLPVINELAAEFAVFDRFFASVPGPTWPNRLMALTATAMGSDGDIWYQNVPGQFYQQKSFFQQLDESGLDWKNFYNDTPWELMIEYVAERPDNLHSMDSFFEDCRDGTLPSFSWINPRTGINVTTGIGSNDFHPTHDAYAAEEFYKDIYEALRSSPTWNDTLLVITFDEHGGFYDHVSTPSTGVPAPEDALEDWTDDTAYFDFERLGVRIPTIAISPWIPKGTIISAAPSEQKPTDSSEYDLTSIMATVRKLFPEMDQSPLTNRDAWSSTFEHIFDNLTDPRSDCPEHLTDAMIPTPANDNEVVESNDAQNKAPLIDIQEDIARLHAHLTGVRVPEFVDQQTHSEWLTRHYQLHRSMTKNFDAHVKGNSETYRVEMLWKNNPAGSGEAESQWDINGIPHGGNPLYANPNAPFHTISTRYLRDDSVSSVPYCLDAGSGQEGATISVSPCLPLADPFFNRKKSQHFFYTASGKLKFYNESLPKGDWYCVTNFNPDGSESSTTLYLSQCEDSVLQSWGYNGYAPGNGGDGLITYGVHFIGVMGASSSDDGSDDVSSTDNASNVLSDMELIIAYVSGAVFVVVIAAILVFIFMRRRGKDEISFVYRDSQRSNQNTEIRPSSLVNQQGSRCESTTEMAGSLTKGIENSSTHDNHA